MQRLTALDGKRRFALAAASSHEEEVGRLRSEILPAFIPMVFCGKLFFDWQSYHFPQYWMIFQQIM